MPDAHQLSRRERQIMEAIYARRHKQGVSASQVRADLPDPPTRTTVRTLLRILEAKGHLTHTVDGREYLYKPTRPRAEAGGSALKSVLRAFFANSLPKALATYLADPGTRLTPEEFDELKSLIKQARKRGD